jgi:hypothetical protein
MSCECFKVGGPFISEDPDCPRHGTEAQREEKIREAEALAKEEKILMLERQLNIVTDMVLKQNARIDGLEQTLKKLKQAL